MDSDNDGLQDNASTIVNGRLTTPKDPEPVKPDAMANLWRAQIQQANAKNVQQSYQSGMMDGLDFSNVDALVNYLFKKYGLDSADVDSVSRNVIAAAVDLALSNRKLLRENREALSNAAGSVKYFLGLITTDEQAAKMSADFGAFILDFRMDEKSVAYHAKPETWQKDFGYNSMYDEVFDIGSSMQTGQLFFNYGGKMHVIWAWRGDYWNLGAGAEIGVYSYNRTVDDTDHYDAISFNLPMTLSLYRINNSNPEHCFSWSPTEKQWWVTGFNYRYQNVDAGSLATIGSINFSAYPNIYAQMKNANDVAENKRLTGSRRLLDYSIFDDDSKTVWLMWYGINQPRR